MRLRRLIAPAQIETTPHGYRLVPEHVEVDAERFERLVTQGTQQLELGEPERAAHTFAEALALWRGEPFVELPDWEPAQIASVTGSRRCDSAPKNCCWTHGCRQVRFRRSPRWRAPASPRHRCVSGVGWC